MNNIETFIQKHISTVNKNNIILINVGKIVSDHIFINKYNSKKTQAFLNSLQSISNVSVDNKQLVKTYNSNNTVFELYSKKIMNYSYKTKDTQQITYKHIDCKLTYMYIDTKPCLHSNYNYDLIEEKEIIIVHYKNLFDIHIVKYTNSTYSIHIRIYKPIEQINLLDNITTVLQLL